VGTYTFKTDGVLNKLLGMISMEEAYRIIQKDGGGFKNTTMYNKITLPLDLAKMLVHHEVDSGPDDLILREGIKSYVLWKELENDSEQKAIMLGLTKDFLTDSEILE